MISDEHNTHFLSYYHYVALGMHRNKKISNPENAHSNAEFILMTNGHNMEYKF